jgi:AcrR family transcriptional regulator
MTTTPATPTGPTTRVATRRERARAETTAEILDAARAQLREVGAAQLSLRAVAGALGMSPAGLYRYYDSREALLTALIAEGFDALAAAVGEARTAVGGRDLTDQLYAAALAFRDWGLAHPHEFGLLYGDPIPGYAAPADGPTSAASRRVGVALLPPLVHAWRAGRLRVPALSGTPDAATRRWAAALAPDLPVPAAAAIMGLWTRLHGLVVLEVFGHLRWLGPDTGPLARAQLEALVGELIAPAPS